MFLYVVFVTLNDRSVYRQCSIPDFEVTRAHVTDFAVDRHLFGYNLVSFNLGYYLKIVLIETYSAHILDSH